MTIALAISACAQTLVGNWVLSEYDEDKTEDSMEELLEDYVEGFTALNKLSLPVGSFRFHRDVPDLVATIFMVLFKYPLEIERLESICRYIAKSPLAKNRLVVDDEGGSIGFCRKHRGRMGQLLFKWDY